MEISVVGAGYVGTTAAVCLAAAGHEVTVVDVDPAVVERLRAGDSPVDEPGVGELLEQHRERIDATTDHADIVGTDLTLVTVATPGDSEGRVELSSVEQAVEAVGEALADDDPHVVAIKSTVPPAVVDERLGPRLAAAAGATRGDQLHVAANPEFLSQGSAVADFREPDRVLIGASTELARDRLERLYEPIIAAADGDVPVVTTDTRTAMLTKYASNAFLATKLSVINELGNVCKAYDVDSYTVAELLGMDDRIEGSYLRSGLGWGGSCLPKDTAALAATARDADVEPVVLEAVRERNERQPRRLLALLERHVDPGDSTIAVLGLAFKPGTDDTRNSRAAPVIEGLQARDASVVAYDPAAVENMRERHDLSFEAAATAAEALAGADAAVVLTGWTEFEQLDEEFDRMDTPVVIDGRRVVTRRDGIVYEGMTW